MLLSDQAAPDSLQGSSSTLSAIAIAVMYNSGGKAPTDITTTMGMCKLGYVGCALAPTGGATCVDSRAINSNGVWVP